MKGQTDKQEYGKLQPQIPAVNSSYRTQSARMGHGIVIRGINYNLPLRMEWPVKHLFLSYPLQVKEHFIETAFAPRTV